MKKEIRELLESENAKLRLNEFFVLRRFKKDILKGDVDVFRIECSLYKTHSFIQRDIKSREFKEIVEEVEKDMKEMFEEASAKAENKILNDFKVGYLSKSVEKI